MTRLAAFPLCLFLVLSGCALSDTGRPLSTEVLSGETFGVAYSGFRAGQHPDRGSGAVDPKPEQVLEDLRLLVRYDFRLIRIYDSGRNARTVLELIRRHDLPIKVLLGIWLDAEFSNHDGCPWLTEPIPPATLAANQARNAAEIARGIALAREFEDIVVAVNVGNEILVSWTDHMVPLDRAVAYVREVKAAIRQPVTVADNYDWWARHGAALAAELDFVGVHTYPVWEGKDIDEGLSFTRENLARVREALPRARIMVLEAGWATVASEFGDRASEGRQRRYYQEMRAWAAANRTTVFFFSAFDEPWKGNPDDPLGAEKHWGLFDVERRPKAALE